jgi:HEAT repeat protein
MKNQESIDKAFEALKTFQWGTDRTVLAPIDDAIPETHGDAAARKELESRLAAVLGSGLSRAAKDFACRKLMVIGTAASVPALASLLNDNDLSHMARYALERIDAPEAAQALRDALPSLKGKLKIGVIGSLGVRRDTAAIAVLTAALGAADAAHHTVTSASGGDIGTLGSADLALATAAATALGDIGTEQAVESLSGATAASAVKPAVSDAMLAAAERLLAEGKKVAALGVYKRLLKDNPPKNVRLAATRGLLLVGGKKD